VVTGSPTGFAYSDEEMSEHRRATLVREHQPDDSAINAQLDRKLPELNLDAVPLSQVVEFLQDVSGVNFIIDWDQLNAKGFDRKSPATLRVRNTTLRRSLDLMFTQMATPRARLVASAALDCIVLVAVPISAKEGQVPDPQAATSDAVERLDRVLPVVHFGATSISQALAWLAKESDVPLAVNWRALERAGIGRDAPITVDLKDVRVSRCLQLICDLVSNEEEPIRYTIDQGIVTVSTSFDSRLQPFEQTYNLHELVIGLSPDAAATREAAILNLVMKTIARDTWFLEGKNPNIRIEHERLVVIQPHAVQRQIPELLTQLWRLENPGTGHSLNPAK